MPRQRGATDSAAVAHRPLRVVEPHRATHAVSVEPTAPVQGSFDAFYRKELNRVLAIVVLLTSDRSAAEDITQEAFAIALRKWPMISGYDRPGEWVRHVAVNKAKNRFRKRTNESKALGRVPPGSVVAPTRRRVTQVSWTRNCGQPSAVSPNANAKWSPWCTSMTFLSTRSAASSAAASGPSRVTSTGHDRTLPASWSKGARNHERLHRGPVAGQAPEIQRLAAGFVPNTLDLDRRVTRHRRRQRAATSGALVIVLAVVMFATRLGSSQDSVRVEFGVVQPPETKEVITAAERQTDPTASTPL